MTGAAAGSAEASRRVPRLFGYISVGMTVSAERLSTFCLAGESWFGNGYDQGSAWIWRAGISPACGLRTKPTASNTVRPIQVSPRTASLITALAKYGVVPRLRADLMT